jgi:hypothetical protein
VSAEKIRALNDEFRQSLAGGKVMMTAGIALLSPKIRRQVLKRVQVFDAFTSENDPHDEHDCGSFTLGSRKFFFKIDYFDANMEFGSEDPADPAKSTRVLTIMFAEEY